MAVTKKISAKGGSPGGRYADRLNDPKVLADCHGVGVGTRSCGHYEATEYSS
jgi:hypothetical protein